MDPDEIIGKIERIEIQGATNVAEAGIELLQHLEEEGADEDRIDEVVDRLEAARPTEPFLFNAIRAARGAMGYGEVLDHIRGTQDEIVAEHAGMVEEGWTVYTHCHSSTVTAVLGAAADRVGEVRVTETRPLYQGRETARELAAEDIPVRFYVDSGGRIALGEADAMMIGADAVTADGTVVNKIGSELFAEVANDRGIPVYVLTDSWKFDPHGMFDYGGDLERRSGDEVWDDAPSGVEVVNYAFERVSPDLVDGIVSELGVLEPEEFTRRSRRAYPGVFGDLPR